MGVPIAILSPQPRPIPTELSWLFLSNCTRDISGQGVYKPFEDFWDEALLNYWTTHGVRTITRVKYTSLFSEVWLSYDATQSYL
jgi:hypothetical protein